MKWKSIPKKFLLELIPAKDVDFIFDLIRIYMRWYQVELLDLIADIPALRESICVKKLVEYKMQLKRYFEIRIEQSTAKADKSETLILAIDDGWDKRQLLDQQCVKTCKQIASVLEKEGQITGQLHGEHLYITIS